MHSLLWCASRPVQLLRILLLLALVLPVPPAFPQTPPTQDRERILAEARLARDRMRGEFQQKASPTCGDRGRYDNEGLHLKVGQFPLLRFSGDMVLRDRFEAVGNGEGLVLNSEIHFLEQCNEQLGLYIVEVSMSEWSETATETIIVELTGPPVYGRVFLAPLSPPPARTPSLSFRIRAVAPGTRLRLRSGTRCRGGGRFGNTARQTATYGLSFVGMPRTASAY